LRFVGWDTVLAEFCSDIVGNTKPGVCFLEPRTSQLRL
jgi:hypothetical protein